jgi:HK97 family phage major capsid protein
MNEALMSTLQAPAAARAGIAAELARYYGELSREEPPKFSLARLLGQAAQGTPAEHERGVCKAAALTLGQHYDPCRQWVPFTAIRTMTTTVGSKGGYLVGVDTGDPIDILRPWSVVAAAGVMSMTGLRENLAIPRTSDAPTASWMAEDGSPPAESPPTIGSVSMVSKTAIAFIKFSMQLLRQGEAVEPYLRMLLLGAIGQLLDQAYFAGAGGAAPLGLLNTPGIGTQSGASLDHADTLAMRRQVLAAGARETALQWISTPAVQELLGARERATGGGRFVWDDGGILGRPAHATQTAAADALVVGDFGQSTVGVFGPGVRIDIDPSQDFKAAGLVARVMLMCDVVFPRPAAFCVASSIS